MTCEFLVCLQNILVICAISIAAVHGDVSHLDGIRDYRTLLNTIDHPTLHNLNDVDIEPQNIVYVPAEQELPLAYQRVLQALPGHHAPLSQPGMFCIEIESVCVNNHLAHIYLYINEVLVLVDLFCL